MIDGVVSPGEKALSSFAPSSIEETANSREWLLPPTEYPHVWRIVNPRHLFLTDMKVFDPRTPLKTTTNPSFLVVSPSFLDPVLDLVPFLPCSPATTATISPLATTAVGQSDPASSTDLPHASTSLPFPSTTTMSVLDPASDDDGRVGTVQAGAAATADRSGVRRLRAQPEPPVVRRGNVVVNDNDPLQGMPRLVPRRPIDDDDEDDDDGIDMNYDDDFDDYCDSNDDPGNSHPTRASGPWTNEGMPRLVPTWPHEDDHDDYDYDEDYGNSPWQLPLHIAGPGAPRSTHAIRDLIERWPDVVQEGDDGGQPA
jgi:hypothetical protein